MPEGLAQSWDLLGRAQPELPPAPPPDDTWDLPGGTAWVYRGFRNEVVRRPVILADGFRYGPSDLNELWFGVNPPLLPPLFDFQLATELRTRGQDVILLGYHQRHASILDNAETAIACVRETIARRAGDRPLVVGGFSMGGLVTRYALAKLEQPDEEDHETAVYLSYDSPHRGAWVPIGVQAAAHFIAGHRPELGGLAALLNSPAAQQLLWRHVASVDAEPAESPLRKDFLDRLAALGGWPARPRKLGVSVGRGDGTGNPAIQPGQEAVRCDSGDFAGTSLYTQARGAALVARLVFREAPPVEVRTHGLPELDGAPGGTLNSFPLAAEALAGVAGEPYQFTCFVPTVSAVAAADPDSLDSVIGLPVTELDDYLCSSTLNLPHSMPVNRELGTWILERIDV